MLQVLNFLSERMQGFMLTMITGAGAVATEAAEKVVSTPTLEPLQKLAIILTCTVAGMTIISYLYKFYKWAIKTYKQCVKK